jgi:8-oxo-dGTP pyrophosphatase MutT (NUDIX family)
VVTRYAAVGFLYHAASRQVLLHHRDAGASLYPECWAGFGGRDEPEDGEDPVATWRREMREELGIELAAEQVRPLRQYINPDDGSPRYIFYVIWPSLNDTFTLSEGDGHAWIPLDEAIVLPDLLDLARGDLLFLRDAVGNPTGLAVENGAIPDDAAPGLQQELYLIADELRGAATLWKQFAANVYEAERADQAMHLAARIASLADTGPLDEITDLFNTEGWGRVSPAVGVDNLVCNERGEVLLLRRRDNNHWCMPGGISEIGQSPAEAVLKELWEEAGLRGETVRLLGVFDGPRWGSRTKVHMIHLVYLVRCDDLAAVPGVEMLEARFFPPDALPEPMHPGHGQRLPFCIELARTGQTYADPSSTINATSLPMHQRPAP